MDPTKVKLNYTDNRKQEDLVVGRILAVTANVSVRNVFPVRGGVIAHLQSLDDVEKLLATEVAAKLIADHHLRPVPPVGFDQSRTIFVRGLPNGLTSKTPQEIIKEINRCNSGNLRALKAFIITNHHKHEKARKTLKLVLSIPTEVDFALASGFGLYHFKVHPEDISKDSFQYIPQCFRCFSFEHTLEKCKSKAQLCSICSLEHHFQQCPTPHSPKCLLCSGMHLAVAPSCPVRKQFIANLNAPKPPPLPNQSNPPPNVTVNFPPLRPSASSAAPSATKPSNFAQAAATSMPNSDSVQPSSGPQPAQLASDPNKIQINQIPLASPTANTVNSITVQPIPPPPGFQPTLPTLQPPQGFSALNSAPQSLPQPSSTALVPSELNIFDLRTTIWTTFAEMTADNDPIIYMALMNEYLHEIKANPLPAPNSDRLRQTLIDFRNALANTNVSPETPIPSPLQSFNPPNFTPPPRTQHSSPSYTPPYNNFNNFPNTPFPVIPSCTLPSSPLPSQTHSSPSHNLTYNLSPSFASPAFSPPSHPPPSLPPLIPPHLQYQQPLNPPQSLPSPSIATTPTSSSPLVSQPTPPPYIQPSPELISTPSNIINSPPLPPNPETSNSPANSPTLNHNSSLNQSNSTTHTDQNVDINLSEDCETSDKDSETGEDEEDAYSDDNTNADLPSESQDSSSLPTQMSPLQLNSEDLQSSSSKLQNPPPSSDDSNAEVEILNTSDNDKINSPSHSNTQSQPPLDIPHLPSISTQSSQSSQPSLSKNQRRKSRKKNPPQESRYPLRHRSSDTDEDPSHTQPCSNNQLGPIHE